MDHFEFTNDEVEEVELAKDLCNGMQAGEVKITCFEILSQLLNQSITIKGSREALLEAHLQLIQYNKFWSEAGWFNNKHIESFTIKLGRLLKLEVV